MKDYVIRAVDADHGIRAFIGITTGLVEKARQIHDTTPVATAALGRTLTATVMMGLMLKGKNNKISVQIKGNGPVKQILAVSDEQGHVKGYISNPFVELPLRADGKLDVGGAVGSEGNMVVIKDLGLKEPYVGQSALVSGEIAEDFTAYFAHSEQQPSAVALGVLVDRDRTVKAAGGFIIQLLPGASDDVIQKLENRLQNLESISSLIDRGMTGEKILGHVLQDFSMEILEKKEVALVCDCSTERLEKALLSIGEKDLKEIIEEDGQAELTCHFCNTKYHFDKGHLERLYQSGRR